MENSKIEWTDHTFNPWIGCTKVSEGCKFCYAEALMDKRYGRVEWGPQGTRQRTSDANWRKPLQWDRKAEQEGRRYRVFSASLADVFEDRPELVEWRVDLLRMIEEAPHLDWLLLTKRPENVTKMIEECQQVAGTTPDAYAWLLRQGHVWIGASVEDQATADERIPHLLNIPARVRFLSMEPLLGPVDLWGARYANPNGGFTGAVTSWPGGVQWVIVGGESGSNARPMHPDWARLIRDQCVNAGVPFHFKQWGEYAPICKDTPMPADRAVDLMLGLRPNGRPLTGKDYVEGATVWVWKAGKHAAGRLLDGREWNEFPK